jgi:signal transduction histidine kinase
MLLLCITLFSVTSWFVLKSFYEHEARSDASKHLPIIQNAYRTQILSLEKHLTTEASNPAIVAALTTSNPSFQTANELASAKRKYHFASISIISQQGISLGDVDQNVNISLLDQALRGETVTTLRMPELEVAAPITNSKKIVGALIAAQDIEDFLFELSKFVSNQPGYSELNIALCESSHLLGTTVSNIDKLDQGVSASDLCTPGPFHTMNGSEHYLAMSDLVQSQNQRSSSPSVVIVDIEPLYNITAHAGRAALITLGLALFIIALGVTGYVLAAMTFFVRPIRHLQGKVAALVGANGDMQLDVSTNDELSMLSHSFSLLSESLSMQEIESDVITRQMRDLLAMSDVLLSTLNLEALLGEIVSRLGHIMQAKSVALLLYGREMQSPWAVARWSNQLVSNGSIPVVDSSTQSGAITVHTDPTGDITMTATTKLAAIAVPAKRSGPTPSGIRSAIRVPKLAPQTGQVAVRAPRIPRPALRDLDMILARMAMQKQKIAYGEDIQMIYQQRGEAWAGMALESGFYSVIAVPLLLQEQVIGAIVLYGDRPYQVSRRDTFLLSTAAIQAAMAIQNVLLFAEVKDKNAALERVNNLKSQFLATVTHELRTPLHSIISYGALILEGFVEGELTAEQEEHIQFIVRRAEDLSHLVDEMLDLSKIEADRLEVKVEPLALEPGLMEVVNQLKPMASNKGLQLTLEMDDSLPMVLADSQRIHQVVINMVSNALKFTEKGGVTIQCALLDRYDMLRISVHDTGIGISPAVLDYIFEAFRQADGSTTRQFGGTGLGLTIARKLIELQGGEVSVESVVGKGSTFSFTLPVATAARARA